MLLADLNADGRLDLFLPRGLGGSGLARLTGLGNGSFSSAQVTPLTVNCELAVAADLDGDGVPEIAGIQALPPVLRTFKLGANGNFAQGQMLDLPTQPEGLGIGDYDLDGALDLAVSESLLLEGRRLQIAKGAATGVLTLGPVIEPGFGGMAGQLLAGDLDSDDAPELVGHADEVLVVPNGILD